MQTEQHAVALTVIQILLKFDQVNATSLQLSAITTGEHGAALPSMLHSNENRKYAKNNLKCGRGWPGGNIGTIAA